VSPLRTRMIDDMTLAGLVLGTRQAYAQAVRRLAARYRRSPDQLSEEEVRGYLLDLRQQGSARGTGDRRSASPIACPTATGLRSWVRP
jgi:Phage integrase, N-terminal SAM-like domain